MNRSLIISITLAILALVWILSGTFSGSEYTNPSDEQHDSALSAPQPKDTKTADSLFKVKVKHIAAEPLLDSIELQGSIESAREIEIRAETNGTIIALKSSKGDEVSQGQQILALALNDRMARLERAKAELKVRQVDLKSGLSLKEKNLLSENQHQQNIANVVAAKAEVQEIEVEIQQTSIKAAFKGILDEIHVELGDYVSPGTPLATLVDKQFITLSADVPQQHIAKLVIGQKVRGTLLDGTSLEGKITYISSSADENTRTFKIEAKAPNLSNLQRFGQSARIRIYIGERFAHKLSPSLLNLSSDGLLQVKGLDSEDRVITNTVDIIRSENDGVWLSGLPNKFQLITVGQGFVSPGDLVETIFNNPEKTSQKSVTNISGATL